MSSPWSPTPLQRHVRRTIEAAQHTGDRTGQEAIEVMAEWVIERESVFGEVMDAAWPIIGCLRGWKPGTSFDDAHLPGVKRRAVWKLKVTLERARNICDWRVLSRRPISPTSEEQEELERARAVISAVHRWMHVGDHQSTTLVKCERMMCHALLAYNPNASNPDWHVKENNEREVE